MALSTRREFLKIAGIASAALGSAKLLYPPSLYAVATGSTQQDLIAAIARQIFPHDRISSSLYMEIAQRISQQASGAMETSDIVMQGLDRIRELSAPAAWLQLGEAEQTSILAELDGSPFFNLLRGTAVQVLYRNEEVWKLLGYGGNALQRGGYPDSFNDIDWLPE